MNINKKPIQLSSLERIILESIGRGKHNAFDIAFDTSLRPGLVQEILRHLQSSGIIAAENSNLKIFLDELKKVDVEGEICELTEGLVKSCLNKLKQNQHTTREQMNPSSDVGGLKKSLGIQKIWMSESEEKIFRALLTNVDTFLNNLKQENKSFPCRLSEQKVVFWGVTDYQSITQQALEV